MRVFPVRLPRGLAPVTVAVAAVLTLLPYEAVPHAPGGAQPPAEDDPFGAECRTDITGSRVVAYCHNAYVDTDRVRLHIECDRWWDIDSDGSPVEAGPARTVRLTGRCWKEVRSAWVSHQRLRPDSDDSSDSGDPDVSGLMVPQIVMGVLAGRDRTVEGEAALSGAPRRERGAAP